jgi:hypothetical protein
MTKSGKRAWAAVRPSGPRAIRSTLPAAGVIAARSRDRDTCDTEYGRPTCTWDYRGERSAPTTPHARKIPHTLGGHSRHSRRCCPWKSRSSHRRARPRSRARVPWTGRRTDAIAPPAGHPPTACARVRPRHRDASGRSGGDAALDRGDRTPKPIAGAAHRLPSAAPNPHSNADSAPCRNASSMTVSTLRCPEEPE